MIHALDFVADLLEQFIHVAALLVPSDEPAYHFLTVGPQPDNRHIGARHQLAPHSEHRIKDATKDDALRASRLVVRNHRAEVPGLQLLTIWIFGRCWVTHAQLVGISESYIDSGL